MRPSLCLSSHLVLLSIALCAGCATSPSSSTPTPPPPDTSVSGNWQGSLVPASGTAPLTAIAGSVTQNGSVSSAGQYTTAVLHVTGPCFVAAPLIPLQGNNNAGALTLDSYAVNGQTIHVAATVDSTGATMQGSYTVNGGCASGASGTLTATRYASLTGTFTGVVAPASATATGPSVSLVLTQAADTTGSGTFLLTGTAKLSGTGCSLSATASAAEGNFVQGSSVNVVFAAADGTGATAVLTGTLDSSGKRIAPLTLAVQGGSCDGVYTSGTLTRP